MIDFFEIGLAHPSWPVNRWISAMLPLFRPQIEWLIKRRDEAVAAWHNKKPRADVYEDRGLNIRSEMAIDVERQMAAIEKRWEMRNRRRLRRPRGARAMCFPRVSLSGRMR